MFEKALVLPVSSKGRSIIIKKTLVFKAKWWEPTDRRTIGLWVREGGGEGGCLEGGRRRGTDRRDNRSRTPPR